MLISISSLFSKLSALCNVCFVSCDVDLLFNNLNEILYNCVYYRRMIFAYFILSVFLFSLFSTFVAK